MMKPITVKTMMDSFVRRISPPRIARACCGTTSTSHSVKGKQDMRSVVVTGASTGIGWACAKLLLDKGFRVFGSVRKPADAERLKGEFGERFTPLLLGG